MARLKNYVEAAMDDVSASMVPIKHSGQEVQGIIADTKAAGGIVIDLSELGGLIGKLLGDDARITIKLPPKA